MKNSVHSKEYKAFRARLVQARKEAGLTQIQVAQALKQTQVYVSKSESGERRVDVVELAKFAKIYNKPLSFFVDKRKSGE